MCGEGRWRHLYQSTLALSLLVQLRRRLTSILSTVASAAFRSLSRWRPVLRLAQPRRLLSGMAQVDPMYGGFASANCRIAKFHFALGAGCFTRATFG